MSDTLCWAYNTLGTIQMEQFLYHDEYNPYNLDANGGHLIDDFLYYQVMEC